MTRTSKYPAFKLGIIHLIAGLTALAMIAAVSLLVVHEREMKAAAAVTLKYSAVNSFDSCVQLGGNSDYAIYPAECIIPNGTASGKIFHQSIVDNSAGTLVINQWRIKLPLTSDIADAYYNFQADDVVMISSTRLDNLMKTDHGCHPGTGLIYFQRARPDLPMVGNRMTLQQLQDIGTKIGSYYYYKQPRIEAMCLSLPTADSAAAAKLTSELYTAFAAASTL